jgi:hypothetical protein
MVDREGYAVGLSAGNAIKGVLMGRATFGAAWLSQGIEIREEELEPRHVTDGMGGEPERCPGGGPVVSG